MGLVAGLAIATTSWMIARLQELHGQHAGEFGVTAGSARGRAIVIDREVPVDVAMEPGKRRVVPRLHRNNTGAARSA